MEGWATRQSSKAVITNPTQQKIKSSVEKSNHSVLKVQSHSQKKSDWGSEAHQVALEWAWYCYNRGSGSAKLDRVKVPLDWFQQARELSTDLRGTENRLFGMKPIIKIIYDADIFATGSLAQKNFHSESRILRYLAIKHCRQLLKGAKMVSQNEQSLLDELKRRFEVAGVYMGSSRAACKDCGAFMGKCGVEYALSSHEPSKDGWLNPFSLEKADDGSGDLNIVEVASLQKDKQAGKAEKKSSGKPYNVLPPLRIGFPAEEQ